MWAQDHVQRDQTGSSLTMDSLRSWGLPFVTTTKVPILIIALLICMVWRLRKAGQRKSDFKWDQKQYQIVSLDDFDLTTSEPPLFRPFKPKYHLTMGIEALSSNDLVLFDKTYPDRLSLRQSLLDQYPDEIVGIIDPLDAGIQSAVRELYNFLFEFYLPSRYPTIFKTYYDKQSLTTKIKNTVNQKTVSTIIEKGESLHTGLARIAENVDEDFFILLPHDQSDLAGGYYRLEAYSACFPSGFKPKEKLGKSLAGIHGPVPGYKEKLQKSMDRFFSRLEAGKCVKRVNWSITVDEELYSNFDKSTPAMEGKLENLALEDLDLNKTFLRCERQTLHRLPTSGAIIFAFHTYLYPMEDIKAEGSGEQLALAIDGLETGSVPEMFKYKNGEKWANAIREFLRSST